MFKTECIIFNLIDVFKLSLYETLSRNSPHETICVSVCTSWFKVLLRSRMSSSTSRARRDTPAPTTLASRSPSSASATTTNVFPTYRTVPSTTASPQPSASLASRTYRSTTTLYTILWDRVGLGRKSGV